jgi:ankyrin repeat protein
MPALANTKHEQMCQLVAKGVPLIRAHEAAGYKLNSGNASTVASHPDFQERLKEIRFTRDREKDRDEDLDAVDADDIDEKWLVDKYRALYDTAKDNGDLRTAKLCLDEIGHMKTLGDANEKLNATQSDTDKKQLANKDAVPTINFNILAKDISTEEAEEKTVDITPPTEEVECPS